jgi:hypothetical protein
MLDLAALHRVREATGTITTGQLILDRLIQRGLVSVEGEQAFINERGRIALSCALENSCRRVRARPCGDMLPACQKGHSCQSTRPWRFRQELLARLALSAHALDGALHIEGMVGADPDLRLAH